MKRYGRRVKSDEIWGKRGMTNKLARRAVGYIITFADARYCGNGHNVVAAGIVPAAPLADVFHSVAVTSGKPPYGRCGHHRRKKA